ncbi:MAG: hypothetical protein RL701_4183 [Pseudomonadota bacterium]
MKRRMKWLKRKKTAPELPLEPPIRLGNMSNGEFFHQSTPYEQKVRAEILRQADEKARKLGMDRREFLASAMGMATSLGVLNLAAACANQPGGKGGAAGGFFDIGGSGGGGASGWPGSGGAGSLGSSVGGFGGSTIVGSGGAGSSGSWGGSASSGSGGYSGSSGRSGSSGGGTGGAYGIPDAATMNCEMAELMLSGDEFIFDVQTHHIDNDESAAWKKTNPGQGITMGSYFSMWNGCMASDPSTCIDADDYLQLIFLESDTTIAVLSGFPESLCTPQRTTTCGNALDNDAMVKSRDFVNKIANSQRIVQHCQVNPTDNLQMQLDAMQHIKETYDCWGFKCYPEWGPNADVLGNRTGYRLDDPMSGIPMIEKARSLNTKVICIHKGIVFPGWDATKADPADVGVVANMYPDTSFVVYHSAIEIDAAGEGEYNRTNTRGTDRLCRTAEENNLFGKNMYAELGSCWAQVMNAPDKAQHVIGKLLKYLGPDNVVWGSECVWLGSPQMQIEAFRTFNITKEFQDKYGYPEITPEIRRKIFGLNSAKMYKIDVEATRCRVKDNPYTKMKANLDGELGTRRWAFFPGRGPRTRREFWNLARLKNARNTPA